MTDFWKGPVSNGSPCRDCFLDQGVLHIQKARLQEVANTLKNWYGVNIVLSSGASDIIYTGVVNKEEKLEVFLRRLEEVSNVKCNCNGKFVTIY